MPDRTHRRRFSIRAILTFGFGGLTLLAVAVILALGFSTATRNTFQLYAEISRLFIDGITEEVSAGFTTVESQGDWVRQALESGQIPIDDADRLGTFLSGALAASPGVRGIAILFENGTIQRVTQEEPYLITENNSVEDTHAMKILRQVRELETPVWGRPIWIDTLRQTAINRRTPVQLPSGQRVLVVQIKTMSDMSAHLKRLYSDGDTVPFVLYGTDHVLAHPSLNHTSIDAPATADAVPLPELGQLQNSVLNRFKDRRKIETEPDAAMQDFELSEVETAAGEEYYILHRELEGYADRPLTIGAYFKAEGSNQELYRLIGSFAVALLVILLTVAASLYLARCVERPIRSLALSARRMGTEPPDSVDPVPASHFLELDDAATAFNSMLQGLRDRERMRNLFGKMVPSRVAEKMLSSPEGLAPQSVTGTVLFCDIEGFTGLTERVGPDAIIDVLNAYFTEMVAIIEAHNGIITQFQGDAILAVFNVPLEDGRHAANAVSAARDMLAAADRQAFHGHRLSCRIGVNTGPMVAGNVGADSRMNYTVHGDAVNTAARLEQLNKEHGTRVLVAESTVTAAPDLALMEVGAVTLRGRSGPTKVFTLPQQPNQAG